MSTLATQCDAFNNIKQFCDSCNKDSKSRKTVDYLKRKMERLEALWEDFDSRHNELLELPDKNIQYFNENVYENVKRIYLDTKNKMFRLGFELAVTLPASVSPGFKPTGPPPPVPQAAINEETASRFEEQECNFSAISHTMAKINVSKVDQKWELEDYLNMLKTKWENIEKLHWRTVKGFSSIRADYTEKYNNIESRYEELKRQINVKIWAVKHYHDSTPKIEIPEFSGDPCKWITFRDLFLDVIHKNPSISNAQKMKHLKSKLKGEAERIVQHLTVSAEQYETCWAIIEQRYDNHRLLFTSFMNTMMNLPTVKANSVDVKRMHDVMIECVSGLQNIGIDTSTWDPLIVYLMSQKLDESIFGDYMRNLRDPRELPRLDEFTNFLENKFTTYDSVKNRNKELVPYRSAESDRKVVPAGRSGAYRGALALYTAHITCPLCNGNHALMFCNEFRALNSFKKNGLIKRLKLCRNCLHSHGERTCLSDKTCKECNGKHHTLLHNDATASKARSSSAKMINKQNGTSPSYNNKPSTSNHVSHVGVEILLTTVLLNVKAVDGSYVTLRCLLDQGSQVNIITERAAQSLRLPRKNMKATLHGVGEVAGDCKGRISLECQALTSTYKINIEALIMRRLVNNLPNSTFEKASWPHIEGLQLADPDYNISRPVDLLLGADVYSEIILEGLRKGAKQEPTAQQTQLGWVLCGALARSFNCHATTIDMRELTRFWETEDILQETMEVNKDDHCEKYFQRTTTRATDGKYVVKMPMTQDYELKLGNSKPTAVAQYLQLEKRLSKHNKLSTMYKDFIHEYSELQHMKPAVPTSGPQYYLPHHGVLREHATTTKLRVVFNASQACPNTGFSLNDVMEKGHNLQKDVQSLLLGWRAYRYAYTADIEKFYRCIWLAEDQQPLQKIIWREAPSEPLRDFQLRTVTYGLKCASWLAMRSLKQLAIDDGANCPEAAKVIINHFYCDDLMSGNNSLEQAKEIQKALISILKGGGMNLRKWASNEPALLTHLPAESVSAKANVDFKKEDSRKTLGLSWNPSSDSFLFNWEFEKNSRHRMTKRQLLSEISKLYDPAGWLSPLTLAAKIIFQKVWLSNLGWDSVVPNEIEEEWLNLKVELPVVKNIRIKRWIGAADKSIQLMGFCDASEKAYACVVYAVAKDSKGEASVTLLSAKTRVTDNYLLCEIHVPLISEEEHTLYKIHPLPVKTSKNKVRYITITTQYVAINLKKNTYVIMNDADLAQCKQRNAETYVCGVSLPVYNLHGAQAPCEVRLLSQATTLACATTTAECGEAWIRLHARNSWLLTCCGNCTMRAICDGGVITQAVDNTNIVTLQQGCVVQSGQLTIYPSNMYSSRTDLQPELAAPTLDTSINQIVRLTLPPAITESNSSSEGEQEKVKRYLAQQRQHEQSLPNNISGHDLHQYILGYSILGLITAAALLTPHPTPTSQGEDPATPRIRNPPSSNTRQ